MSMNDPIANAISHILNCEKLGRPECRIENVSKLMKKVLDIMRENHYIGEYKVTVNNNKQTAIINLIGNINKCGAIKPRFSVEWDQFEKFEKRYLPAQGFGILIISTNKGLMTHAQATEKKLGGRLIVYCY